MRFKFQKLPEWDDDYENYHVEHTFEAETLPEIMEKMKFFLQGCSFFVPEDGTLEIITPKRLEDTPEEV